MLRAAKLVSVMLVALGGAACQMACGSRQSQGGGEAGGGEGGEEADPVRPGDAPETEPEAAEGHPRIWIRQDDLPRLRKWARDGNPVWVQVKELARKAEAELKEGKLGKTADCVDSSGVPCEFYAEFFAFLSLVHPDEKRRSEYGQWAHDILMKVINEAAKGDKEGHPLRTKDFTQNNRSRWAGEAFAVTFDWIYPYFTDQERAKVRKVFLDWNRKRLSADMTSLNHPEPQNVLLDKRLVEVRNRVRFAGNNYYTSHMRNNGLGAIAIDPGDDPGGELGGYLENSLGAWLYVVNHLKKTDAAGGVMPEGLEYGPQTMGYAAQLLLAVHTAGRGEARFGDMARLDKDPYWGELITAYLHQMAPAPVTHSWMGELTQPAWFGDGQNYWAPEAIDMFGPLGVHAYLVQDDDRLETVRWIQLHLAPGGTATFPKRIADDPNPRHAIWYFLLFDPDAEAPEDPRPSIAKDLWVPGLGHIYSRTGWGRDARYFTWKAPWKEIDHQHAEALGFELYRGGEWLTKEWTGYGNTVGTSEYHNTLAVENGRPYHHEKDDYRYPYWKRGSQYGDRDSKWKNNPADPKVLAKSFADGYVYALGDATGMYNSEYEKVTDVTHVSRSIVWLKPDHVVVYDRAETKTDKRFKRFWLNFATQPKIEGHRATVKTKKGQRVFVTSLLPKNAELTTDDGDKAALAGQDETAKEMPMAARLRVQATGGPKSTRFLHVIEGADGGKAPDPATLIHATSGDFEGTVVRNTAVLFPIGPNLDPTKLTSLSYTAQARAHLVTGLEPHTGYTVTTQGTSITIRKGGPKMTDTGGVLTF